MAALSPSRAVMRGLSVVGDTFRRIRLSSIMESDYRSSMAGRLVVTLVACLISLQGWEAELEQCRGGCT